jgi:hypothetical protein
VLSTSEIARGTQGALGFLRRDRGAPLHFDNSMEACLRSFRVMILAAPIYVFYLLLHYSEVAVTADEFEIAAVEALRYVVDWLIYPVIFYEVARRRGLLDRYPRYIAALNWIALPEMIVLLIGESAAALMPVTLAVILQLGLQALFFYWFLTATRMTLSTNWPTSIVLMIVNWLPSLFLSLIVDRFLGVGAVVGG